jgi:hypothetical protein
MGEPRAGGAALWTTTTHFGRCRTTFGSHLDPKVVANRPKWKRGEMGQPKKTSTSS